MRKVSLFFGVLILSNNISAQTLPEGFFISDLSTVTSWNAPVGTAFTSDGQRVFVWEKDGRVYVCNREANGNYTKQSQAVLDISDEVGSWIDHGLMGFALDPKFEDNGYIYALYVVDRHHLLTGGLASNGYSRDSNQYFNATIGRVTRYTTAKSDGNILAVPSSRKILIGESKSTGLPMLYLSHGVGSLVFASDGTLLVSCGDGASFNTQDSGSIDDTYYKQALIDGIIRPEENVGAFRAQMLNSHNGKLLRINPENGDGVISNPFFDASAPRSPKSRVWAMGFRNPFRFTIKPGTGSTNPLTGDIGEVIVGDVGWGAWEELDIVKTAGTNFGWPLYEGQTDNSAAYISLETQNGDELNTFGPCGGRTHYRFKDLLRQDNAAKNKSVYNPCNPSQLIGTQNRYIHARPALDWTHETNIARVGKFDVNGFATYPTIGTAESEVIGNPFKGNCTVGGIWYTGAGNSFPPEYKNTFIAGDFGALWIRRVSFDFIDVVTRVDNFVTNAGGIVSLTENPLDGSLVFVDIVNYTVNKISFGGNIPPVAKIKADNYYTPSTSFTVNFDGTESYDQDGSITSYSWDFGDPGSGSDTNTSSTPAHQFTTTTGPKKFTVTLTVTDSNGASGTGQFIVSVNNTPPQVTIINPEKNSTYKIGSDTTYIRQAMVSDHEQNGSQLTYEWQTTLVHNNHTHPGSIDGSVESGTVISRIGCNGDDYSWLITLKVTDAAGLSASDSSQIFPDCESLPMYLHKFSVTQLNAEHLVKWTTEQELGIDYYELQRSTNGTDFTEINRQVAANSNATNNYSYSDNSFLPGVNYYRLKIVERNTMINYSIVIRTETQPGTDLFRIVPNPVAGDDFSLLYSSAGQGIATIIIYDVAGRLVHSLKEEVNSGQNIIYIKGVQGLLPGIYFVSINKDGKTKQGKLIKTK